ncbi:MAG: tetratricopeptide repeat protein [Rhizomicrobium sp.]
MNKIIVALCMLIGSAGISPLFAIGAIMGGGTYGHGIGSGSGAATANAPENDDYAQGRRLIHFEKYADAIPYLSRAHSERPHDADILAYLGFAHHMVGDDDLALEIYQRALTEDPNHLLAHDFLGELYLSRHDIKSAQAQLAALTSLCPSGCDETASLSKSIATYQAAASATPATPPKSAN